jgi:anti-sigma B factor antagonist
MHDQQLSYTISDGSIEGVTILKLEGPLTLSNIFEFQSDLRALKPLCLIMDLSGTPYMDSAGLGVIVNYYVSSENKKHKLFLSGVNGRVLALLEMTKVNTILKLVDSVDEAQTQYQASLESSAGR